MNVYSKTSVNETIEMTIWVYWQSLICIWKHASIKDECINVLFGFFDSRSKIWKHVLIWGGTSAFSRCEFKNLHECHRTRLSKQKPLRSVIWSSASSMKWSPTTTVWTYFVLESTNFYPIFLFSFRCIKKKRSSDECKHNRDSQVLRNRDSQKAS